MKGSPQRLLRVPEDFCHVYPEIYTTTLLNIPA